MFKHWFNPFAPKPRDHHAEFDRSQAYYLPANFNVAVGVATGVVVPGNDRRKKLTFTNDSDSIIYLSKGPTAALNMGIRLNAAGGGFIDEIDAYGYLYRGAWSAISSGAGKNLCVISE